MTEKNANRVQLTLPSNPRLMSLLRGLVSHAAKVVGFPEAQTTEIVLAVDEACTNIIRHCYQGDCEQTIVVYLEVGEDRLEVALRDFGEKRDPSQFKSRDLDEVRPGGLGMHFIYSIMDKVEFDTSVPTGMLMRMIKYHRPTT